MSKKKNEPFLFQSLKDKSITFTIAEQKFIDGLKPLIGGEWEGKIKASSLTRRTDRDTVVKEIKDKLIVIQGSYCIYCGLHEDHCGQLEREHIAPKGTGCYPHFMFEPLNLALACHHCNCELKGEEDTISTESPIYKKCKFNIVHPYLDDYEKHIQFAVKNGRAIIKSIPWSRKGKATIKLFELDSVPKTDKRSGLLMVNNLNIEDKYDELLELALKSKYMRM